MPSDRVLGILTEPNRWAVLGYRVGHWLWRRKARFLPLFICMLARVVTAAEIHPAAVIGKGFRLAHGVGVVVGNCVVIGADCLVMQGVTIGARSSPDAMPTLGDRVFIGANAVILGSVGVGDDVKIGAGAVVLRDVPSGATVVGNPAHVVLERLT